MNIGLIGKNITHSYSKIIHQNLGCLEYKLYDINNIDDINKLQLDAFNVTHPYKKDILRYLKQVDPIAKETQSVNTVIKKDGDYIGFNTDYAGFESMMDFYKVDFKNKHIVILGHGATSKTIGQYLKSKNTASIHHLVRHPKYDNDVHLDNQVQLKETHIIINTTPIGMYPHTKDKQIIDFNLFPNCQTAIDVIYNPHRTSFLLAAETKKIQTINGLYMLLMQAVKTEEIIFNKKINTEIVNQTYRKLLLSNINIVFIGLPLSGKSHIGRQVSQYLKLNLIDTDQLIVNNTNLTIAEIFKTKGESYFRNLEQVTIESLKDERGTVISTGGGVILNDTNMINLKQNGLIIYINKDLKTKTYINDNKRPLIQNQNDLVHLAKMRNHIYKSYADIEYVINDFHAHSIERLLGKIYEYFNC